VACSCAAGPAFEGSHIQCGMRGASGAIDQVIFRDDEIEYHVIDEVPSKGICGSGLVDAVAGMLRYGLISADGRMLTRDEISNPFYATRARRGKYNLFSLTGQQAMLPGGEEVVITVTYPGLDPVVVPVAVDVTKRRIELLGFVDIQITN